jgi:hypothetical protein
MAPHHQYWARLRRQLWQPPRPHGEHPRGRVVGPLNCSTRPPTLVWMLTHLPLTAAIAAMGAAVVSLTEHAHAAQTPIATAWGLCTSTGALAELEYALDVLELDWVVLLSNYDGIYLGDPRLDSVFQELHRRQAVVFVHPTASPDPSAHSLGLPDSLLDFVADTSRAVARLHYSGTFARTPDVTYILSHAGGTIPYLAGRFAIAAASRVNLVRRQPFSMVEFTARVLESKRRNSCTPYR